MMKIADILNIGLFQRYREFWCKIRENVIFNMRFVALRSINSRRDLIIQLK